MSRNIDSVSERPRTIPRACGGWLAIAGPTGKFRIAVTGGSEDEAIAAFARTQARWNEIVESDRNRQTQIVPASRG